MIYALPFFLVIAAAFLSLRSHSKETRLVLSTTICRPPSSVFKVVSDVRHVLVWRRHPRWLPRALRISTLSRWGEHTPADQIATGSKGTEENRIRCLPDREFAYAAIRRGDFSYESSFYLEPDEGKCLLTWEIRYQADRWLDIVSRQFVAAATRDTMASSLDYIQRLALSRQEAVCSRNRIYETRRGQIPAA